MPICITEEGPRRADGGPPLVYVEKQVQWTDTTRFNRFGSTIHVQLISKLLHKNNKGRAWVQTHEWLASDLGAFMHPDPTVFLLGTYRCSMVWTGCVSLPRLHRQTHHHGCMMKCQNITLWYYHSPQRHLSPKPGWIRRVVARWDSVLEMTIKSHSKEEDTDIA